MTTPAAHASKRPRIASDFPVILPAPSTAKKCNVLFVIYEFFVTLRAVSNPLNPTERLLSALDLGPSWARDAVPRPSHRSPKAAADVPAAEVRPARRADDRKDRGFAPRSQDRPGRDDRRGPARGASSQRRFSRPEPEVVISPAAGVKVLIEPNTDALHLIAKEVAHVARVYSLFDIAKTLLSQRERYHGVFTVEETKAPIYYGHRDHSLWLTKEEAVQHFWKAEWRGDLYEEEVVEIDGPTGNFQVIAKCGLSGKVLGPPNYHAYQSTIRQVHRELFPNMPFDRYAAKIVTERSEEAVQAWLHGMKTKLRWKPVGQEETVWLEDRAAVEQHFLNHRFPEMYVATHRVEVPANTPVQFFSPSLLVSFKNAARHAAQHPAIIIPTVCNLLEKEHLPVFKKQGKLYAGPSRPHPIPDDTAFADRMELIVNWMRSHPETKLAKLWKGVLPEGETDPSADWLADLFWLLSQGHLLLFADDNLILPLRRKAEESPAAKTDKAKSAKTTEAKDPKEPKARKRKNRKRRKPLLLVIEKRVADLPPLLRKRLHGFDRTIAHRLRLKAQARLSLREPLDDVEPNEPEI